MKPMHIFVLLATATVFLATFFLSTGLPTGLFADDRLKLSIGSTTAYEDAALITWSTNHEAISTLVIDNKRIAFNAAKVFSTPITGLAQGTTYDFAIRACDASQCVEKQGTLTTKGSNANAITGAVMGAEGVTEALRTSASLLLYIVIGAAAIAIAGRIGYEKLAANRDNVAGMLKQAERHLEADNYSQAAKHYSEARQAFMQLKEEAKLKHYNKLLGIYQSLKRYAEVREAQQLTEKYEQGTITREELRRLNELLAG